MKPKVSIITSVYRSEKYLESFLKCVLSQSISDEIQLILNLSSPSNDEKMVLKKFSRFFSSLTLIEHDERISIYRAWNECLQVVEAPLIAIWNVDDLRVSDSLERQVLILESEEVKSVTGTFTVTRSYGDIEGRECVPNWTRYQDFYRSMLHGPFFMFKAECLSTLIGFDEQFLVAGDFDFAVRLSSIGSVGICEENLGFYLNNGVGASTTRSSLQVIERDRVLIRYGAMDLIDVKYLPNSTFFDVTKIHVLDNTHRVADVCKNFMHIRDCNLQEWRYKYFSRRSDFHIEIGRFFSRLRSFVAFRTLQVRTFLKQLFSKILFSRSL